jgi:prepilin-type processing-associated H-X9-DG protein
MAQPYIIPGQLNRLRANVTFSQHPELQIISNYLTEAGISMTLEGEATNLLPAMMSLIASPAPYMRSTVTIALIRSIPMATTFKNLLETDTVLGQMSIFPDTDQLQSFLIWNAALESVRELAMAGREASMVVTCVGYYMTNTAYYDGHVASAAG